MTELRLFTSESVTEGHPDKICDQISDSILDAILADDPHGRVAVETLVTTGLVHVAGEVSTSAYVEIPAIVRARREPHRLHLERDRLRRRLVRRERLDRRAVVRHRRRRRQGVRAPRGRLDRPARRAGRRRPGHHVRLRDDRDAAAHADGDLDGAPHGRAARRGAPLGRAAVPAPRRQDAGHARLRRRSRRRRSSPSCCRRSTTPTSRRRRCAPRSAPRSSTRCSSPRDSTFPT